MVEKMWIPFFYVYTQSLSQFIYSIFNIFTLFMQVGENICKLQAIIGQITH